MLVSNHPQLAGGSHLPDITVITPVFEGGSTVVFFVASRGHHAGKRDGILGSGAAQAHQRAAHIYAGQLLPDCTTPLLAPPCLQTSAASPPAACPPTPTAWRRREPPSSLSNWCREGGLTKQASPTCCWPQGAAATPPSAAPAICRTTCLTSKPRWD